MQKKPISSSAATSNSRTAAIQPLSVTLGTATLPTFTAPTPTAHELSAASVPAASHDLSRSGTRKRPRSRSRRIQQQTRKRSRSCLEHFLELEMERLKQRSDTDATYHARASSLRVYGFVPDIEADVWTNRIKVLGSMTPRSYFNRPNNMAFHNLCQNTTLPPGIANLLGLGLKYYFEAPQPWSQLTGLQQSLTRFERTVRIRHLIPARRTIPDLDYIQGLYIPLKWQPDCITNDVEHHLEKFRKDVLSAAT